jgi:hypothetical protein
MVSEGRVWLEMLRDTIQVADLSDALVKDPEEFLTLKEQKL